MYFEITPHKSREYDCAVMPADSEDDYAAAFQYAKDRLDQLFDELIGSFKSDGYSEINPKIEVSVKLCDGEMPEIDE